MANKDKAHLELASWCTVVKSDCSRDVYKCRICSDAWQAATKAAEEKFTSHNTGSPKMPEFKEFYNEARCVIGQELNQGEYILVKRLYGFICRRLRAL